jgi:hypothetical protein
MLPEQPETEEPGEANLPPGVCINLKERSATATASPGTRPTSLAGGTRG